MSTRQLHLNLFIFDTGHHEAAWRMPESEPHVNVNVKAYQHLAKLAEEAKFDSLFLADSPAMMGEPGRRPTARLDPTILLSAIAASTDKIGLIATASTTYNAPYELARRLSSLDHISAGRAGWNIVTTSIKEAARSFGLPFHPGHAERYDRADEFVQVVTQLWQSWQPDAVIADKAAGIHAIASKIKEVKHHGEHFSVEGPLNISRSPQLYPVLVQAGSSEGGKAFAAKWAEAVFTAQTTYEEAQVFYTELKTRAANNGRNPDHLIIMPGVVPVIADTLAEARELEAELNALIIPEYALNKLASVLQIPVDDLHLDRHIPDNLPPEALVEGARSRRTLVVELARRENLTVRQLIKRLGGGRGHWTLVGTPTQAADALQHYFEQGAADGFNIMPALLPSGLTTFVKQVVPILQERGLFRREYSGNTLREHYGLPLPAEHR
ncbi:LLM class flavin-dependent oxidoreductase [Pantoea sp. DY-15]|uniref:LLM class flavin-dependent oxidoreductase n=1 Tax=Pantoea sp. DY-15 TaxID=2871489 RepID=UPI001C97C3F0|nr:LLM class flavin-dependent oxidoreductase [Pantoea sp. DY-15]MBY4890560.1 LLM class flavin-dependent oxidoreductase [Pantoea sp. DY-15]